MPAAFKVKQFITCGFHPGEVRGAEEFPVGTDFVRLVQDGALRPLGDLAVLGGDPKTDQLLDQIEDLTDKLASAEAARFDSGASADAAVAERDREIVSL